MAGILSVAGTLAGAVGIFFGFALLSGEPARAISVVTVATVGVVGVLAFVRHVVFHRADAARLGWETDRPDWMFEVGFANLGFGVMGVLSVVVSAGPKAQGLLLLGYALYLLQAAALHGYRYFADGRRSPARLWRSCIATALFAGMMVFFAVSALVA